MNKYSQVEILSKSHITKNFDCGEENLNCFLKKYALQNQKKKISNTFVTLKENKVVGFYTLTFGSIAKENYSIRENLPNYPIPVIILARLAVNLADQENGIGKALLKDAILKSIQASTIGGLKAILVQAKNQGAKSFYQKFDFTESGIDELTLILPLDIFK